MVQSREACAIQAMLRIRSRSLRIRLVALVAAALLPALLSAAGRRCNRRALSGRLLERAADSKVERP